MLPLSEEQPAVKTEPLNIVAFLNGLPKTEHDPNSLTIDTGFVSPALLTFVVTGQLYYRMIVMMMISFRRMYAFKW